jgi:hypothetical protein
VRIAHNKFFQSDNVMSPRILPLQQVRQQAFAAEEKR